MRMIQRIYTLLGSTARILLGLTLFLTVRPASAQGTWTPTGSMNVARNSPGTAVLPDGRVLVQGGGNASGAINSAEIYDPSTGTWTPTSNILEGHAGDGGTIRLADGRVLVCGDAIQPNPTFTNLCEIYDPVAGTWSRTGGMNFVRAHHRMVLLPSGLILALGGDITTGCYCPQTSAERYNPLTGTWTVTGSMAVARSFPSATLLGNGKVLVAGGSLPGASETASAELYDPVSGVWAPTGSMSQARFGQTALLLGNGEVLVAYGITNGHGQVTSAELYDPNIGTWSLTGSPSTPLQAQMGVLLNNGQALVTGGLANGGATTVNATEFYDPNSGVWTSGPTMNQARYSHAAVLLFDGRVLVAGGNFGSNTLNSAEIFSTPAQMLSALTATVTSLNLLSGIANSLDAKLQAVQSTLAAAKTNDINTACNQMNAFINAVSAQSGTLITAPQADQLIGQANVIKAALGCP